MDSPDRQRPALLASVLLVVAVTVVGLVLVLTRGGPEPEPEPEPEPPAAVEPEPAPEPEPPGPVVGEYELLRVTELSVHDRRVFGSSMPQNAPIEHDQAAVDAFVAGMAAWLDGHLTDLQDGGVGSVFEAGLDGPHEVLTLTSPGLPVEQARYEMVVWAREQPEWGRAAVEVALADGSAWQATVVFVPGDPPTLLAADGTGPITPPVDEALPATGDEPEETDT
jgi:hypothetical protein